MLERAILPAVIAATVFSGLMAGIFYAFSSFVMAGLARVPHQTGIASMQLINVTAIRPSFMILFMGTAAFSAFLAVAAYPRWDQPGITLILAASLIYLIGSFWVTIAVNVPLNDALAAMDPSSASAAGFWPGYLRDWVLWNHVRTAAALTSSLLFGLYLIKQA